MSEPSTIAPTSHPPKSHAVAIQLAICGALAVIAIGAFWPAHSATWVNWDDDLNLTDNLEWRGLTGEHLKWMFTTGHAGVYQPLGWLAFAIQHALFDGDGGRLSFGAYHAVSLGLHAFNAILVFLVCLKLLRFIEPPDAGSAPDERSPATMAFAGVAALLFAVHPLRTECVAWLSCQPYLWAALFALGATWVYLTRSEHMRGRGIPALLLVTVLFGISLLFKAIAIALPAVLLVLDVYPLRRVERRDGRVHWMCPILLIAEKLPMLAVAAFAAWRGHIATAAFFPAEHPTWMQRGLSAVCATVHYLRQMVAPIGLSPRYEVGRDLAVGDAMVIRAIAIIGVLTLVAIVLACRRRPGLLASWLSYLFLIGPVLGFVWHGEQFATDRYTYLAGLPWVALIGGILVVVTRGRPGWSTWAPAPLVMASIVLFALSWRQSKTWADSVSLWRHALAVNNESSTARLNLGLALASREVNPAPMGPSDADLIEARALFERVLESRPGSYNAWKGLGIALAGLDLLDEAVKAQENALRLRPSDPAAIYSYATALSEAGRYQEAKAVYERAIELAPKDYRALTNLGITLSRISLLTESVERLNQAIKINPGHARAWYALGNVHVRLNQLNDARRAYEQVLRFEPDSVEVRVAQAELLDREGRREDAIKLLAQTADTYPMAPASYVALGRMLQQERRWRDAKRVMSRGFNNLKGANRVDPSLNTELAWLLATCPDEEIRNGYTALQLAGQAFVVDHGRSFRTLEVLAAASAANGQFDQAVDVANRAIEAAHAAGLAPIEQVLSMHLQFYLRKQPLRFAEATTQPTQDANVPLAATTRPGVTASQPAVP